MSHGYSNRKPINASANPGFSEILEARISRRQMLKSAVALAMSGGLPLPLGGCATGGLRREGRLGFKGIAVSTADTGRVPQGYSTSVLYRWGDPVGHASGSPEFKPDASNTAAEHGKAATAITPSEVEEYHRFLALVPPALLDRIDFLRGYVPRVA